MRLDARQRRDALSGMEVSQWSDKICRILEEQPCFMEPENICFYYPLGNEVNLLPLAERALQSGKRVSFPRVSGDDMEFYQVSDLQEFAEGAFHVMEPTSRDVMGGDALVFVPGLLFDGRGGRMGYGKGYYDRYFSRHMGCRKIGVCYEMQFIRQVPCNRYDVLMDDVVTEQGIRFRGK